MTFRIAHLGLGAPAEGSPPRPGRMPCARTTTASQEYSGYPDRQRGCSLQLSNYCSFGEGKMTDCRFNAHLKGVEHSLGNR
jgi:hypothetical protein